jgi:hypothetical protein
MDCRKEDNEDLRSRGIELQILRGLDILSAEDVKYFVENNDYVDEVYKELNRWTITTDIYYRFGGRYYKLSYRKGTTEEQENEYWPQYAVEVEKVQGPVWKEVEDD